MLPNLTVLNLRENNIRKLSGFSEHLVNLVYLNVRGNKITKVRQFRKLAVLPKLDTLILLDNPLYEGKKGDTVLDEEDQRPQLEALNLIPKLPQTLMAPKWAVA
nr:unnamed protein product [Callosobruchus analis]